MRVRGVVKEEEEELEEGEEGDDIEEEEGSGIGAGVRVVCGEFGRMRFKEVTYLGY